MTAPWSGARVMAARTLVATWLPMKCGRCDETVRLTDRWVVGHKKSQVSFPELRWEVSNWQPEHRKCSDASAQAAVIEKAKRDALAAHGITDFSRGNDAEQPPPLRVSLSATGRPLEARADLAWSPAAMRAHPWTAPYAEVPGDAAPPLFMTPVPADAVGSYGQDAITWIEEQQSLTLRWWQRLAIVRQLEHREDGSLCHTSVIESAPRRAGKSVRIRGIALWRMAVGPRLFGETQLVMHTGSDVNICREIQRAAWPWAEDVAGWEVGRANGKERVETQTGDRWLIRAQRAVTGYDVCLGIGDECWDVAPGVIDEGLEPAMLERSSPQLHLTSTAHRRATSLMKARISAVLFAEVLDPETLLLVWAAPHGSDPSDPAVWRAASPHWTESRRRMIASKFEKAMAGEVDLQADDPDPMAGFVAQYLNVWHLREPPPQRGDAAVSPEYWQQLVEVPPIATPDAVAIEAGFVAGVSLAYAWRTPTHSVVSVTGFPDLGGALAAVKASGFRGLPVVGASLLEDPALARMRTVPGKGRSAAAVVELTRLLEERALRHDGGTHLTGQVIAVRTAPGSDGPRIVSKERADGIKAAVWAASRSRLAQTGKPRILRAARR